MQIAGAHERLGDCRCRVWLIECRDYVFEPLQADNGRGDEEGRLHRPAQKIKGRPPLIYDWHTVGCLPRKASRRRPAGLRGTHAAHGDAVFPLMRRDTWRGPVHDADHRQNGFCSTVLGRRRNLTQGTVFRTTKSATAGWRRWTAGLGPAYYGNDMDENEDICGL